MWKAIIAFVVLMVVGMAYDTLIIGDETHRVLKFGLAFHFTVIVPLVFYRLFKEHKNQSKFSG